MAVFMLACVVILAASFSFAQESRSSWADGFRSAIAEGNLETLKPFFADEFAEEELASWAYAYDNGHLLYGEAVIRWLSEDAFLLHIPTDAQVYSHDSEDGYFDFIYRVYRVKEVGGQLRIAERCMDDFGSDFLKCRLTIEALPERSEFAVAGDYEVDLKTRYLIFRLEKEFEIEEFSIGGAPAECERLGYVVLADAGEAGKVRFSISGIAHAPSGNNQFLCVDENSFFLRCGGFAATPTPPIDDVGRYHFSNDETEFDFTYVFPAGFELLSYGEVYRDEESEGRRTLSARMTDAWMDGIAFYAQRNWDRQVIEVGKGKLTFLFPEGSRRDSDMIAGETKRLLEWMEEKLGAPPMGEFNFAVVEKFYVGGLLNDSHSIVAADVEIIRDGGYIHEVCHLAPQPSVKGSYLWIKEGFTNYLSMEWLRENETPDFWRRQRRSYLNYYGMFGEPLSAIRTTRSPNYLAAYQRAPWIYRMLEFEIGEEAFSKAMHKLGSLQGQELENLDDYCRVFDEAAGRDIGWFWEQWLERKELPVIVLKSSHEATPRGRILKVRAEQRGPLFRIPLGIEIVAGRRISVETVLIESQSEDFEIPLEADSVSVAYDPGAKIFGVLRSSFAKQFRFDALTATGREKLKYRKRDTGEVIEFGIERSGNGYRLLRLEDGTESVLTFGNGKNPTEYSKGGEILASIDPEAGTITANGRTNDLIEAVFPYEFAPLVVSLFDWDGRSEESFLFLMPGERRCRDAVARIGDTAADTVEIEVDVYFHEPIKLHLENGILVRFRIGDGEEYELLES